MKESKVSTGRCSPCRWKVVPQSRSGGRETPITEFVMCSCYWSWTAVGDDPRPTEGDSRLRGTREPLQQATDVRAPRSWTMVSNSLPDFIRDPTSSIDCFRRLLKTYLFACSRVTSTSSASGVLMRYTNPRTHSLTHWLWRGVVGWLAVGG